MRCCPLRPLLFPLVLASLLVIAHVSAAPVRAQAYPPDRAFWEITPQVGVFVPEDLEGAEIEARLFPGARVSHRRAAGFGVELHGAFATFDIDVRGNPPEEVDLPALFYGADILYAWPIRPRSDFFVSVGAGGVTWFPDREGADADAETNPRVTLGAGVHVLLGARIAVRGDLRDHIIFDHLADTARDLQLLDRGQTNNLEVSVGAAFLLP